LHDGGILQFLGLMVRPLGRETFRRKCLNRTGA
jgi:hypothetical protein